MTCSSTFEDPTKIESENRQRNLQYDVSFHDLEDGKRTVQLTSGDVLNHLKIGHIFHGCFFIQGLMPRADFASIWNAKGTN